MERFTTFARNLLSGAPLGPLGLATVTVRVAGTDDLATIYSADGASPLANPFQAGSLGQVGFYAANGRYDVTITPHANDTTAEAYTLPDCLLYDPAD